MQTRKHISESIFVSVFFFCVLMTASFDRASAQLVLDGAYIKVSGGTSSAPVYIVVDQPTTLGIARLGTGGHIYTEGQYNFVQWNTATSTGNFVFPFGHSNTDYIPFTFDKTSSGSSNVAVSTWNTNQQNVPHPGVSSVAACWIMTGLGDSLTTAIDRFWDVRTTATTTANLTYSYRGSENTTTAPTSSFKVQRWTANSCAPWTAPAGPGNSGVTSGVGTVGPLSGETSFTPFVLVRADEPLLQPLSVNAGSDVTIYSGLCTTLGGSPTASAATSPYSYSWSSASGLSSTTSANAVSCPSASTTYTVLVTDNRSCTGMDMIQITLQPVVSYATLKKSLDADFYSTKDDYLFFTYKEEYNSGALSYKIYDYTRDEVVSNTGNPGVLVPSGKLLGSNRFALNLAFLTSGMYTLEVTNEKNETVKLKFKKP